MAIRRQSDADLVREAQAGHERAFRAIVERYQRLVFGVTYSVTTERGLAEDLAQEAFLAAWKQLRELREPEKLGSWLAGIGRNLALGAVRQRGRRQLLTDGGEAAADVAPSPLDLAVARENELDLSAALAKLPESAREPLILFYVQGRSVRQVALALGLGEDAVKQRLSRGRKALREELTARVESALAGLGPSPGFVAAVLGVTALVSQTRSAAAAAVGKVGVTMSLSKISMMMVVMGLGAAGGAVYFATRTEGPETPAIAATSGQPLAAPATSATSEGPTASAPRPSAPAPASPARLTREAHAKLLGAIRSARARREQARAAAPQAQGGAPAQRFDKDSPEDSDKDVIRRAVAGIRPLVQECYENALERDPSLAGFVAVDFTVEGEPDVGGVIGSSQIHDDSTIKDAELRECIQETMYAIEIEPPSNGGTVAVTYPFSFSSGK